MYKVISLIAISTLLFYGCASGNKKQPASTDIQAQTQPDKSQGGEEVSDTATEAPSRTDELVIEDMVNGQGAGAKNGDKLEVHYRGTLTNGTQFDSSYDFGQPFTFTLGQGTVIAGWEQGLVGMKAKGKRKLTIPPALAYGSQGVGDVIAPNSTLIFEIELLKIN